MGLAYDLRGVLQRLLNLLLLIFLIIKEGLHLLGLLLR